MENHVRQLSCAELRVAEAAEEKPLMDFEALSVNIEYLLECLYHYSEACQHTHLFGSVMPSEINPLIVENGVGVERCG